MFKAVSVSLWLVKFFFCSFLTDFFWSVKNFSRVNIYHQNLKLLMGGCYNTIDLDRSPAKLGNWYHTDTCMLSTKYSYQIIKLQFKNKKTVPFIWSMCISQYTLIFNLEQMTLKSNNNFIKESSQRIQRLCFRFYINWDVLAFWQWPFCNPIQT